MWLTRGVPKAAGEITSAYDDLVFYVPFNILKSYRDDGKALKDRTVMNWIPATPAELEPMTTWSEVGSLPIYSVGKVYLV